MNHNSFAALLTTATGRCPSMEGLGTDVLQFLRCSHLPVLPHRVVATVLVEGP
jgi:hypothetical protein